MMVADAKSASAPATNARVALWTETTERIAEFVLPLTRACGRRTRSDRRSLHAEVRRQPPRSYRRTLSTLSAVLEPTGSCASSPRPAPPRAGLIKLVIVALGRSLLSAVGLRGRPPRRCWRFSSRKGISLSRLAPSCTSGIASLLAVGSARRCFRPRRGGGGPGPVVRGTLGSPAADYHSSRGELTARRTRSPFLPARGQSAGVRSSEWVSR